MLWSLDFYGYQEKKILHTSNIHFSHDSYLWLFTGFPGILSLSLLQSSNALLVLWGLQETLNQLTGDIFQKSSNLTLLLQLIQTGKVAT